MESFVAFLGVCGALFGSFWLVVTLLPAVGLWAYLIVAVAALLWAAGMGLLMDAVE